MENVRGKNTRRKHLSKNKKKSWRKINVDDVEDFLEDERLQERTGGKVAEKTNEALFFVDKVSVGKKKVQEDRITRKRKAQEKLLDIEEGLKPPPEKKKDKRAPVVIQKELNGQLSVKQKNAFKQRKIAKQEKRTQLIDKNRLPVANYDLWEGAPEAATQEDEHFLTVTRKRRVKVPEHHKIPASKLPAVEVPLPGASYNPAFDDHQELLSKAHAVEIRKVQEEERIRKALDAHFPSKKDAPTEASKIEELSAGLFDEEDEENAVTENPEDLDKLSVNPPDRRENKKDEKQRRKIKERKEEAKKAKEDKLKRMRESTFFRLKSIKAELNAKQLKQEERSRKKADYDAKAPYRTKKLGKLKFQEPDLEVKLSDELVGSLRELKPEGHLLEDRFKSFQKRNIIEPREKATRKKQKRYRKKVFEKKDHKAITA